MKDKTILELLTLIEKNYEMIYDKLADIENHMYDFSNKLNKLTTKVTELQETLESIQTNSEETLYTVSEISTQPTKNNIVQQDMFIELAKNIANKNELN